MLWVIRCLALAHFAWGLPLVFIAVSFGVAMLRAMPDLSSGAVWTDLPGILLLVSVYTLPFGGLGLWMIVLGRWAWMGCPRLRRALLITHGVLLLPGTLSVVAGVSAMRAAERSTASGGGILSPVAAFPVLLGVPIVVLALCSIATALTLVPSMRRAKTGS